jgi:2',3'-cyclic-nucleotide 2'-phosphodiesterase (5'-nucleotidase family)
MDHEIHSNPISVTIFHTNDMHGRLGQIPRLSHRLKHLRREAEAMGRLTFYWDAGDAADRRTEIGSITKGAAFSKILNAMECDLQTMGNAISLPYGPQAMQAVTEAANFPILAANFRNGSAPIENGVQESILFNLDNTINIGVAGLTAPWGNLYEAFGLFLPGLIGTAQETVKKLQKAGADYIVFLNHVGIEEDRKIAETIPEIDLIVGGHSHTRLDIGEICNGVLITQTGEYAQALGRIDLDFDPSTGKLLKREAQVIDVPENEPTDPLVTEAIREAEQAVKNLLATPLGYLESDLNLDHFNECGIGNFTADVMRKRMKAEVAILSSGLFHAPLPKGMVNLGLLNQACFSSANPCVTSLTGEQIKQALENGLDPKTMNNKHHGFRGTPIGIPQISGMQVEYNPDGEPNARISDIRVNGKKMDPTRSYRVAHTDAEMMGGEGYFRFTEPLKSEQEVPTIVREAMEDHLKTYSPIPEPEFGRWIIKRN